MNTRLLLSSLIFAAMCSAAIAAEPLSEQEMDTISAGQVARESFNLLRVRQQPYQIYFDDPDRGFIPG